MAYQVALDSNPPGAGWDWVAPSHQSEEGQWGWYYKADATPTTSAPPPSATLGAALNTPSVSSPGFFDDDTQRRAALTAPGPGWALLGPSHQSEEGQWNWYGAPDPTAGAFGITPEQFSQFGGVNLLTPENQGLLFDALQSGNLPSSVRAILEPAEFGVGGEGPSLIRAPGAMAAPTGTGYVNPGWWSTLGELLSQSGVQLSPEEAAALQGASQRDIAAFIDQEQDEAANISGWKKYYVPAMMMAASVMSGGALAPYMSVAYGTQQGLVNRDWRPVAAGIASAFVGNAIGAGANQIAPEAWQSMSPAMQNAVMQTGSELVAAGIQERDVNWSAIAASVASGVTAEGAPALGAVDYSDLGDFSAATAGDLRSAGMLSQPMQLAGTGDLSGMGLVEGGFSPAPGFTPSPILNIGPSVSGHEIPGVVTVTEPGGGPASVPEANLPAYLGGTPDLSFLNLAPTTAALGGFGAEPTDLGGYTPEQVEGTTPEKEAAPAEQEISLKDVAKYAELAKKLYGLLDRGDFEGPEREEGQSDEAYAQQLVDYLGLDLDTMAAAGIRPGTPEYYQYIARETDRIIEQLGVDPEFLGSASAEELKDSLRGKRQEEMEKLARALFVRGQLGTLANVGEAVNPFTGEMEQLGAPGMFQPTEAAFQRGLARESETLAGLRGGAARDYLGELLGRAPDLFGMQASADARMMRALLAEQAQDDPGEYRKRLGWLEQHGPGQEFWARHLEGLAPGQLEGMFNRIGGGEQRRSAALDELFGR